MAVRHARIAKTAYLHGLRRWPHGNSGDRHASNVFQVMQNIITAWTGKLRAGFQVTEWRHASQMTITCRPWGHWRRHQVNLVGLRGIIIIIMMSIRHRRRRQLGGHCDMVKGSKSENWNKCKKIGNTKDQPWLPWLTVVDFRPILDRPLLSQHDPATKRSYIHVECWHAEVWLNLTLEFPCAR